MAIQQKSNKESLSSALQKLLTEESAGTQEEICQRLLALGFSVNQTKVSRLLREIGAVKVKDEQGHVVYWLPKEPPPPEISSPVSSLIIDIVLNESLIVVHTSPGSASLVARLLDYQDRDTSILGCLAGDDTIFITPTSVTLINQTLEEVRGLLSGRE